MTSPTTLDNFIKSVIEELRELDFSDDEIAKMITETVDDAFRAMDIANF